MRWTASGDEHPDIAWKRHQFGVVNTSLGRGRYSQHRTASDGGILTHSFNDPRGWQHNGSSFEPSHDAVAGARAFASEKGLRDPHEHDFRNVMQSPARVKQIGRHYDSMPDFDAIALPHFHAMAHEVEQQHHFMTHKMGVRYESVDHDPYPDVHSMVKDVRDNKRIKVMGTRVTGAHPVFTDEQNDKFRAVHDLFGHAATGRDFSRHGEEAAFQAHSRMFSQHARPAMAAETRGQNTSLILNNRFSDQKVGILPARMHEDSSIDWGPRRATRVAIRITQGALRRGVSSREALCHHMAGRKPSIMKMAHDSGDGETLFHCPFVVAGR